MPRRRHSVISDRHFLQVAPLHRQHGSHEFYRIVRLEISRLQGDHRISRAVRLVKAIVREQLDIGKDRFGIFAWHPPFRCPFHKTTMLLFKVLLFLLAHGAAHQIGFRGAVSRQVRSDS